MTKYKKDVNGNYIINGHKYEMLEGSRAQVMHGTAYKTSGGLIKNDLTQNKNGRIVSRSKHRIGVMTPIIAEQETLRDRRAYPSGEPRNGASEYQSLSYPARQSFGPALRSDPLRPESIYCGRMQLENHRRV